MMGSTISGYDGGYPDLEKTFEGFGGFDTRIQPDLFADINWPDDQAELDFDTSPQIAYDVHPRLHKSASIVPSSGEKRSNDEDSVSPVALASGSIASQSGVRFSRQAKSVLRVWFNEHKENPYPTSDEKDDLAVQTGLKRSQISLWLVNTRRRYRARKSQQSRPGIAQPSLSPQTLTGSSSSPRSQQYAEDLNPMDRWKILPLELEATPAPTIMAAVANAPEPSPEPVDLSAYPTSLWDYDLQSSAPDTSNYDAFWTPSMGSYDTGLFSGSTISDSTALSYSNRGATFSSVSSQSAKTANGERRRRRCHTNRLPKVTAKDRPFQCTFGCISAFATKHDWQRHEKSQHISLESWTCCLSGGTIETVNGPLCAFCGCSNPDSNHLETHNFSACQEKDLAERTFYRKDHFQQHLRLTHQNRFNPEMDLWKAEVSGVRSRCGFCNADFNSWAVRTDHLAAHFKCHANMKNWKGDLGFETHIAAIIERAAPQIILSPQHISMSSMPPPKHPASYYSSGSGGGGGAFPTPSERMSSSLREIMSLEAGFGTDSSLMNLSTTAVTDFGNIDHTFWSSFGV